MLISSNFASQTRWSIFALGPQMYQAAPAWKANGPIHTHPLNSLDYITYNLT